MKITASDGKEFTTARACKAYEKLLEKVAGLHQDMLEFLGENGPPNHYNAIDDEIDGDTDLVTFLSNWEQFKLLRKPKRTRKPVDDAAKREEAA